MFKLLPFDKGNIVRSNIAEKKNFWSVGNIAIFAA